MKEIKITCPAALTTLCCLASRRRRGTRRRTSFISNRCHKRHSPGASRLEQRHRIQNPPNCMCIADSFDRQTSCDTHETDGRRQDVDSVSHQFSFEVWFFLSAVFSSLLLLIPNTIHTIPASISISRSKAARISTKRYHGQE